MHTYSERFVPQYARIYGEIARQISSGSLKAGDPIPSLREICRRYDVSMITARRVHTEMVNGELASPRAGRGLFVTGMRRRTRIALAQIGFPEEGWRRNSEMFGQLVGGIAGAAWERDASLNIIPINDARSAVSLLGRCLERQPLDGLLLRTAGDVDPDLVRFLQRRHVPFVCVKRRAAGVEAPSVRSDDRAGARLGTEHLVSLGHRRIGLIVSVASQSIGSDIEAGYRAALGRARAFIDDTLIVHVPSPLEEAGRDGALRLLARPRRPTAIVASSDLLALGIYDAAARLSLKIPADVAVVGFDDQEFAARLVPPLTTLRVSYYDLGHRAAQLLFEVIAGRVSTPPVVMRVALVVRGSTVGPAAARGRAAEARSRDRTGTRGTRRALRRENTRAY